MPKEADVIGGLPSHVAIIMDGNGRWALKRGLPRIMGHYAGVKAIERTVRAAADIGIPHLSLYAFSTENWRRPLPEVKGLMNLFRYYVRKKTKELCNEGVRLRFAGRIWELSEDIRKIVREAENATAGGGRLDLVVCFNYGGRQELLDAINSIVEEDGREGAVTEEAIRSHLYLPDLPDPDLIIRTSGEHRLSNFWLWQSSYSELYFTSTLWPDFGKEELDSALEDYAKRERRFGAV
ncbi:polyprenyl diphosphate synthase [Acetomicrobium sp. S15 = DSM 107314]|jgi:undecaprenyl diphosphate synthase|uniref:polyprenyl diphosphate synthase n=1 Tax=Acetomicrobium sp. S15 = DSM 107314 TaxID=2529858 RepID=UPI0018E13926|nr:polyprenyl diphosphate synthase [Acetomicrobium sp. S15 = DSM 107314]